jgi:hypothetical protein
VIDFVHKFSSFNADPAGTLPMHGRIFFFPLTFSSQEPHFPSERLELEGEALDPTFFTSVIWRKSSFLRRVFQ